MNKPVVAFTTSWDDGFKEDEQIIKLLEKYQIHGDFYITVENVEEEGYIHWKRIRELDKHPLFEIGSHTMSHPRDLKELHDELLFYEIQNSKELIEVVLGHKIRKFCYPRGRHNERVREMVLNAGYLEARTTVVGSLTGGKPLQTATTTHVFDGRPEYKFKDWYKYGVQQFQELLKDPEGKIYHLWGHSKEVLKHGQLQKLDHFFEYVTSKATLISGG